VVTILHVSGRRISGNLSVPGLETGRAAALLPFAPGFRSSPRFRAFSVARSDQVFPQRLYERHRLDRANALDREKASWSLPNVT
jgi:hypothetical protein